MKRSPSPEHALARGASEARVPCPCRDGQLRTLPGSRAHDAPASGDRLVWVDKFVPIDLLRSESDVLPRCLGCERGRAEPHLSTWVAAG